MAQAARIPPPTALPFIKPVSPTPPAGPMPFRRLMAGWRLFGVSVSSSFHVPSAEQRHDSHGDGVRSKQRQYDCQGQSRKEKPAHTVQKRDGEEYHRARQRRGEDGQSYFLAAFLRRHLRFLAEFQVSENVLEN